MKETPNYAVEVVPPDELVLPYAIYVYDERRNGPVLDNRGPLYEVSLAIGRACELISYGQNRKADAMPDEVGSRLGGLDAPTLYFEQDIATLQGMTNVIRARSDPERLASVYEGFFVTSVEGARKYRNRIKSMKNALGQLAKIDNLKLSETEVERKESLSGHIGHCTGKLTENLSRAVLMSMGGIFAMPSLIQHDSSNEPPSNHDLVVIAKPYQVAEEDSSELEDKYLVRRVQIKSGCLAFCEDNRRQPDAVGERREARKRYDA
jgi:hypothetical protein